ncbi:MAG: hypothetical protein DRH50_09130 [Deltaproteobacteria bacterium]|nr:MAG: hypothetical protein DRH50_09130 [Deltaproteobacteria bacterium]
MEHGLRWTTCFLIMFIFGFNARTVNADTLLFPVIAVNPPNVTTIVSVVTRPGIPVSATHLKYIYRYKDTYVGSTPNHGGACSSQSFVRPTYSGDLVSFDASGSLGAGNALFSDTDSYGSGGFALGGSDPQRAYLLVTHADSTGSPVNVSNGQSLNGEAIVMDIAYGAAWGYRAINDSTREDYTFLSAGDGGGVWSCLPSNGYTNRRVTFFSPDEWTTRFFVTPIGSNMATANLSATVRFVTSAGIYDRIGTKMTTATSTTKDVVCTGAVDLSELMDASMYANIEHMGGWTWFSVSSGTAVVYKLEYVVDDSTYGGTNNNAYLLSTYDLP